MTSLGHVVYGQHPTGEKLTASRTAPASDPRLKKTHFPEVEHVHEDGDVPQADPAADVVVPQHDEALAELQTRLFR